MTKNSAYFLAIVIASFLTFSVSSQPSQDLVNRMMPKPVPASPNVASLGKYGDYQVSHFTGLPDISIPIYEVQSGDLKVPITLSYHAAGIKPTDVASWVGMGWSLSAGGQISRTVNGKRDEEHYSSHSLILNPSVCGPPGTGTFYYLQYAASGVTDTEPDVFSYSFGGRRGKFMLPYNAPPFLIPYASLDISTLSGLTGFEIVDEAGVLYRFGRDAQGVSCTEGTTATNGGNPVYSATTAWHLGEVVSPNSSARIAFDYQDVGGFVTHDISYSYVVMDECFTTNGGVCPTNSFSPQILNNDSWGNQKGLETITFETGKVEFVLSGANNERLDMPGLQYLDRINIYSLINGNYILKKAVKFNYSYFTNAGGGNAALKLDGVQFLDKTGSPVQQYSFDYFTNSFSWDPATNYLNARDLWGYYNGALSNSDLLLPKTISYQPTTSTPPTTLSFGGAFDRAVNSQYAKEGVLKKIHYPTGGYTEFDFESNRYMHEGSLTLAGGLRVSKIISSDGTAAPPILKTYKYGHASGSSSESGYGLANFSELQFNYSGTQLYFTNCLNNNPVSNYRIRSFHSNSAFGLDQFDGSPVVYPYVTEYIGDFLGTTNGKIAYVFDAGTPAFDVNHLIPNSSKYFRNSFFWKRGKLTSRTVYDNSNNKLSELLIQYTTLKQNSKSVGLAIHQFITGALACGPDTCRNEAGETVSRQTFNFGSLIQDTGVLKEDTITEYTYENGNVNKLIAKVTSTTYDPVHLQPTLITTTGNAGEIYKTVNRYPFQLAANSSSTENAMGIYMLNNKHILSSPVETYTYLAAGSQENLISAQVSTFRQHPGNPIYVVPDQVYFWEPSAQTVPKSSYAEIVINGSNDGITMDEDLAPRINMMGFSAEGKVLSVSKSEDIPIAYQYGYNKALPIAEVKNAQDNRYSVSTETTGSTAITVGGVSPVTSSAINFTVDYQGTVRLKLGVNGTPSFTTYVDYSGSLGNGSMTLGTGSCANTEVVFNNVSPGAKTIYVTVRTETSGTSVGACGHVEYPKVQTTAYGFTEFVFENFEEGSVTTSPLTAHTGEGYLSGDYTPTFVIPNARTYTIEYWYWNGSAWMYNSKPYIGTSTPVNEGTAIDNVRIYPTDAVMTSYTYDPILGITSVIDANGLVMYYDYDDFGRLWRIRNDKGNVEKQYTYHYKGN